MNDILILATGHGCGSRCYSCCYSKIRPCPGLCPLPTNLPCYLNIWVPKLVECTSHISCYYYPILDQANLQSSPLSQPPLFEFFQMTHSFSKLNFCSFNTFLILFRLANHSKHYTQFSCIAKGIFFLWNRAT
jgi:hypothetical protein